MSLIRLGDSSLPGFQQQAGEGILKSSLTGVGWNKPTPSVMVLQLANIIQVPAETKSLFDYTMHGMVATLN